MTRGAQPTSFPTYRPGRWKTSTALKPIVGSNLRRLVVVHQKEAVPKAPRAGDVM